LPFVSYQANPWCLFAQKGQRCVSFASFSGGGGGGGSSSGGGGGGGSGGGPSGPRRYSRDYDRGYDRGGYDRYDDREYYNNRSYR